MVTRRPTIAAARCRLDSVMSSFALRSRSTCYTAPCRSTPVRRNLKIPDVPAEPDQLFQAVIAAPKSAARREPKRLIGALRRTRRDCRPLDDLLDLTLNFVQLAFDLIGFLAMGRQRAFVAVLRVEAVIYFAVEVS
jgi:hypothetical protein